MPLLIESIALGLVLSVLFAEFFGLSAAGLIVPGYLAYHLNEPIHLFVILFATIFTLLTEKLLGTRTILYGRRLLALDVLLSFFFVYAIERLVLLSGLPVPFFMDSIGYFIPALIVIFIGSNGLSNTLLSLVLITLLVRGLLIAGAMAGVWG